MNNYFRITAYHPTKNISVIMDSNGKFEKLWQFSSFLVQRGFKVLTVGNEEAFKDGNIRKVTEREPNKLLLRACATGKPVINGNSISLNGKFYTQND